MFGRVVAAMLFGWAVWPVTAKWAVPWVDVGMAAFELLTSQAGVVEPAVNTISDLSSRAAHAIPAGVEWDQLGGFTECNIYYDLAWKKDTGSPDHRDCLLEVISASFADTETGCADELVEEASISVQIRAHFGGRVVDAAANVSEAVRRGTYLYNIAAYRVRSRVDPGARLECFVTSDDPLNVGTDDAVVAKLVVHIDCSFTNTDGKGYSVSRQFPILSNETCNARHIHTDGDVQGAARARAWVWQVPVATLLIWSLL